MRKGGTSVNMSVVADVKEIIYLSEEVEKKVQQRKKFLSAFTEAFTDKEKEKIMQGKTPEERMEEFATKIVELLNRIDRINQRVAIEFGESEGGVPIPTREEESEEEESGEKQSKKKFYMSAATRKKYLREIGASKKILKRIMNPKYVGGENREEIVDYTVYETSVYGSLANMMFRPLAIYFTEKYPKFFARLYQELRAADMNILSKTYVSCMLLSTLMVSIGMFLASMVVGFFVGFNVVVAILLSILVAILGGAVTFFGMYIYPSTVVNSRKQRIRDDLPFMTLHMAAIAGSGAKPVSIFKLIVNSGDYKGVESEIRKIVNYVNLFGYDISTALKTVAKTTPSERFRALLNGMVATIESGGSLKSYLNGAADDAMTTYELERRKYVKMLSTYSDIYIGILIAAPLLFLVTLAIINVLGGNIAGISIKNIAIFGTYVMIPALNIFFILFLNVVQPEL